MESPAGQAVCGWVGCSVGVGVGVGVDVGVGVSGYVYGDVSPPTRA